MVEWGFWIYLNNIFNHLPIHIICSSGIKRTNFKTKQGKILFCWKGGKENSGIVWLRVHGRLELQPSGRVSSLVSQPIFPDSSLRIFFICWPPMSHLRWHWRGLPIWVAHISWCQALSMPLLELKFSIKASDEETKVTHLRVHLSLSFLQ